MPTAVGPNTKGEENLVFGYDLGDVSNSYKGEPTTNTVRFSNNVTGSNYGYNDEYEPCQLVKTWLPNLPTPLGYGATQLTQQAVNSYWHCVNWFDGDEDGKRCLSAFIYPLTSGITNFYLGMVADASNGVFFNLDTLAITYGAGLSNTNAFINPVIGYPGWYRVGANIEGRAGGWVASIGIGQYQQYTPTAPFKSFYLCGLQYERGGPTHVTQPLPSLSGTTTTRSATQGLIDLTGNSTIDLTNVSFDSNAQMTFDGTNDTGGITSNITLGSNFSMEAVVYRDTSTNGDMISSWNNPFIFLWRITSGNVQLFAWNGGGGSNTVVGTGGVATGAYKHVVITYDGVNVKFYTDGTLTDTFAKSFSLGNATAMQVGSNTYDSIYFDGRIPFSKIYNRALTASEVQSNYNAIKGRFNI